MSEPVRRWEIILTKQPAKVLRRLPRDLLQRLDRAILALADDPQPAGCKKLTGYELYRIRVGDWRVTYSIQEERLVILVVEIAPRGDAYRDL